MWENFQQAETLMPFQQQIYSYLEQNWANQRRLQISCSAHVERDKALIQFLTAHRIPAMVLCQDRTRQSYWLDLIRSTVDPNIPESIVNSLVRIPNLSEELSPLSVMTYSALCRSTGASDEMNQQARKHWERELAFAPVDPNQVLSFGDLDAINETSEVLADTALRNVSIYMDGIQSHVSPMDQTEEQTDIKDWLSNHVDYFVELFRRGQLQVILCDESHLLEGLCIEFVNYLRSCMPMIHLIGLSPTPINYSNLSVRACQLHKDLFSNSGLVIDGPAMVRDGCHSPYRELLMIVEPSNEEQSAIQGFLKRFHDAFNKVDNSENVTKTITEFAEFELGIMTNDAPGFWARRNEFLRSLLHYHIYTSKKINSIWTPYIGSFHKTGIDDILVFLRDYIFHILMESDSPQDRRAGESLIQSLRPLGITLTETDIYFSENMVPNILEHSSSKVSAMVEVLEAEIDASGDDIRALVLTDFSFSSISHDYFPDTEFDFTSCSSVDVLNAIIESPVTKHLNPIVIAGHTMIVDIKFESFFRKELDSWQNHYHGQLFIHMSSENKLCTISFSGPAWNYNLWAEMLSSFLETGLSSCIIGSRLLLNSKWDSLHVNTLFNLTSTESSYVSEKLHSRLQRYDEMDIGQTSHLWDFMCIQNGIEYGMSDYERLNGRKSEACCICEDGEFEFGVGHLFPLTQDTQTISEKEINSVQQEMLALVKERHTTYKQWKKSKPTERQRVTTFELRLPTGIKLDSKRLFSLRRGSEIIQEERSITELYKSICTALVKSIPLYKNIAISDDDYSFELVARRPGAYRLFFTVPEEINEDFVTLLTETFAPIDRQHYVIAAESHLAKATKGFLGGLFGSKKDDKDGDLTLFAVPKAFKDKKLLKDFTLLWQTYVSVQTPHANRLEEARLKNESLLVSDGALFRPEMNRKELWR